MAFEPGSKVLQDGSKSIKRFHHKVLVLIGIIGVNVVAVYMFSRSSNSSPSDLASSSKHLEQKEISVTTNALIVKLSQTKEELKNTQRELQLARADLKLRLDRIEELTRAHLAALQALDPKGSPKQTVINHVPEITELQAFVNPRKLPLGWNPSLNSDTMFSPVGHRCLMQEEDMQKFMDYKVGGSCPDDEALAQKLLLAGCEPLPRRRCFAQTPANYSEPYPIPRCFWEGPPDGNIVWTPYECKSFECLNTRNLRKVFADCLDCFDLEGREKNRWQFMSNQLDYSIEEVLALKGGSIRIGLDIGGGTGSFAVRMRERNVTIVTTTLNLGGPFNNFIAQRGVIPLFLTIAQRLPFFDNTLDIVHSMHVLSNWIPDETLEFILLDIDRVLRPGGVFWLDHFFCLRPQLNIYVPMIERLGYKKLKWGVGEKLDRGRELQEMYVSAVLEKPLQTS